MAVRCFILNKIQILNLTPIFTSCPLHLQRGGCRFTSLRPYQKLLAGTVLSRPLNQLWGGNREDLSEIGQQRGASLPARARRRRWQMPTGTKPLPEKVEKELELEAQIGIEEEIPEDDQEVLVALDRLKVSTSTTRDTSLDNLSAFDVAELSILLCNDNFIRKLNKEWRDKDEVTDVLSMSQHIPGLQDPTLMLGDIVISVETAARQAEERGQTVIDEIRILMVHGLLHLLGYDHELSEEAEKEMENEEECILSSLGWKGKGLIHSTYEDFCEDTSIASTMKEEES
ncbi:endoribonuclease YBEY, chloroplastic isoform X2 [Cryptomeria japonica]|uniref:endoribonuclease YBEY, chloroplastic isoform X2 n=1 Tax=Cryptomeria japonica TaxID=3369 RepID=UPI0027DA200D|nr:endoribonuclease YBEY, chloroplastic isoform X2 [Cryptomeria japonica]